MLAIVDPLQDTWKAPCWHLETDAEPPTLLSAIDVESSYLQLPVVPTGDYRLEIVAERRQGTGHLFLFLPVPGALTGSVTFDTLQGDSKVSLAAGRRVIARQRLLGQGVKVRVAVTVRDGGLTVAVQGKELFQLRDASRFRLGPKHAFVKKSSPLLGVYSKDETVFRFHEITLTPLTGRVDRATDRPSPEVTSPEFVSKYQQLSHLRMPSGTPLGSGDPRLLLLIARQPRLISGRGGILHREVLRQALLVAAGDELQLATSDDTLRQGQPRNPKPASPALHSVARIDDEDGRVSLTVFRREGDAYRVYWDEQLVLPQGNLGSESFEHLVTAAEERSRGAFVGLLKQLGYRGQANAVVDSGEPPADTEKWLEQMTFTSQFAALRGLHGQIKQEGESPQRLGALVRGYANLGLLTECYWSAAHKAFKARALIYAERMIARWGPTAHALWHRAYARALCGRHRTALLDLAAAREAADGQEAPPWVGAISAACRFETERLVAGGEASQLALLLHLKSLAGFAQPGRLAEATERLLDAAPDCYRGLDVLAEVHSLGISRYTSSLAPARARQHLYRRLLEIPNLPEKARALAEKYAGTAGQEGDDLSDRGQLIAELRAAATSDRRNAEMSWDLLGRLIEELTFLHAWRRAEFLEYRLGVPFSDEWPAWQPAIAGHRYRAFLAALAARGAERRKQIEAMSRPLNLGQLTMNTLPMLNLISEVSEERRNQVSKIALHHNDPVYDDLVENIESVSDGKFRQGMVQRLQAVSPHAPATVAYRIRYGWKDAKPFAAEWEEKYGDVPKVLLALGEQHLADKDLDDAERCLQAYVERVPDYAGYRKLAAVYDARGDFAQWQQTLETFIAEGESFGLEKAQANQEIARKYMGRRQWQEALPYAEAAAGTGAAWAMLTAAECYEQLQDYDRAEALVSATAQRYEGNRLTWYRWCRRTGHGNAAAAEQLAEQHFAAQGELTADGLSDLGQFKLLVGLPKTALDAYEKSFAQTSNPYTGLFVALLAEEAERPELRDRALAQIIEKGEAFKFGGKPRRELIQFARQLQSAYRTGGLNLDAVDRTLAAAPLGEQTNLNFFVGRYLWLQDRRREARSYLQRCVDAPTEKYVRDVAAVMLREDE